MEIITLKKQTNQQKQKRKKKKNKTRIKTTVGSKSFYYKKRQKNLQKTSNLFSKRRSLGKKQSKKTRNASATYSVKNCNKEYFLIYGVHKKYTLTIFHVL